MTSGVYIRNEKTINMLRELPRGRILSEFTKKKISNSLKGKNPWNKDKKLSEDTKLKISNSLKGENNPNYGKILTESHKQKIRDSAKNNPNYGMRNKHQSEEEVSHSLTDEEYTEFEDDDLDSLLEEELGELNSLKDNRVIECEGDVCIVNENSNFKKKT